MHIKLADCIRLEEQSDSKYSLRLVICTTCSCVSNANIWVKPNPAIIKHSIVMKRYFKTRFKL